MAEQQQQDQQHQEFNTELGVGLSASHRQSLLINKSTRRSTLLARPQNQDEAPVANPDNTIEENQRLEKEYESIRSINKVFDGVIEDFEETTHKLHQFSETVSQTDKLLDLWLAILQRTEDIKLVLEDESFQSTSATAEKGGAERDLHEQQEKKRKH